MAKGKTCEYCGDELVYDTNTNEWACETCDDAILKKYSSGYLKRITSSKPYQFFFGPKDFDIITRKASKRLWKGIKGALLGAGLIIAFVRFFSFNENEALVCCLAWAVFIVPLALLRLWGAKRYFKKLKPAEDPMLAKGHRWSVQWILPNYLVVLCIMMFCFLAIVDIYTLGRVDKGNFIVGILREELNLARFLDAHPYLLPTILWYFATRSMTHAYRESFEAGHRLAVRSHDASLLKQQKMDKWYKKMLLFFTRGIGFLATFKTMVYTGIFISIFILNVYMFHQGRREDFMGGLFSGINIVIFQICFLILIFISMSWVTRYVIKKKYPTTVFSRLGKLSLKVRGSKKKEDKKEDGVGRKGTEKAAPAETRGPRTASKGQRR